MHAYRDQYAQLFHDGRNVVLIAISVDAADTLGGVIGKTYGAHNPKYGLNTRNLYVVGPDGKIAYRAAPFREIDPTSYKELGAAIDKIAPKGAGSE